MNPCTLRHPAFRARGFTLIELLVVVAIIAILAAISTTAYQSQVTKATRAAAKSCLSQYAQYMERFYTTGFTYVGAVLPDTLPCASDSNMGARYEFTVVTPTPATYRVLATPTSTWNGRESRCGTLTLNEKGERGAGTGSDADISYCW